MSGTLSVSLSHRFPGGRTLDLAFTAPIPGVIGLFGPSGAGKSSLLAALSGLFRPDRSAIELGGRTLSGPGLWLRPERRRIGVVFQDGRLFPHLSVDANLRYGLRRASPGRSGHHPGGERGQRLVAFPVVGIAGEGEAALRQRLDLPAPA
jgi:molybdate transport system ATP-binding protein